MINVMSEYLTNVTVRNSGPHPIDLLGHNGQTPTHESYPIDPTFKDSKGNLTPIRAEETREQLGTLKFLANRHPIQLPVDIIRLTGRLDNENLVRKQLRSVYESVDGPVIVTVSPLAYAALRWAGHDPHVSSSNPVGFAIPAGIERDDSGQIRVATRLDQPEPSDIEPIDEEAIERQRQYLLNLHNPYSARGFNYSPAPITFTDGSRLERIATTEPAYNPTVIGYTSEGTPITQPGHAALQGESHHPHDVHLIHPRGLTILRQRNKASMIGQSFMTSPERLANGTFTRDVGRLAVLETNSLSAVAHQVA